MSSILVEKLFFCKNSASCLASRVAVIGRVHYDFDQQCVRQTRRSLRLFQQVGHLSMAAWTVTTGC